MSEKIRLIRLIEKEFTEWQKIMQSFPIDSERREELEKSIRGYADQYKELTGKNYVRSNFYA